MYDPAWLLFVGVILFCIWAVYTLQEALWPNRYFTGSDSEQCLLVLVENLENTIEGVMWDIFTLQQQMGDKTSLVIIDVNSKDRTLEILKKMVYPNRYFSIIQLNGPQELEPLLEKYKKHNCLIIDYMSGKMGILQGITLGKSILHQSGRI